MSDDEKGPHNPEDALLPPMLRDGRKAKCKARGPVSDAGVALRLFFSASLWPDWRHQAAEVLGISVEHLGRIERGRERLSPRMAEVMLVHARWRRQAIEKQAERVAGRFVVACGEVAQAETMLTALRAARKRQAA